MDEARSARLISMPNPRSPVINDIVLLSGRYFTPGAEDEVIMNRRFAEANGVDIGEVIEISVDQREYDVRVVGLALSPEYVYMIRDVQELAPSPERFGVLWAPEDFAETAADMPAARNNIVGEVEAGASLDAMEYDTFCKRS